MTQEPEQVLVQYWTTTHVFQSTHTFQEDIAQVKRSTEKKATLSAIKRSTKQNIGDKSHEGQAIKGKVIWTTRVDGGDALIGVRSENMVLSKKLFESILLGDNKIQARKVLANSQKEKEKEKVRATAASSQKPKAKEFAQAPAVPNRTIEPTQKVKKLPLKAVEAKPAAKEKKKGPVKVQKKLAQKPAKQTKVVAKQAPKKVSKAGSKKKAS